MCPAERRARGSPWRHRPFRCSSRRASRPARAHVSPSLGSRRPGAGPSHRGISAAQSRRSGSSGVAPWAKTSRLPAAPSQAASIRKFAQPTRVREGDRSRHWDAPTLREMMRFCRQPHCLARSLAVDRAAECCRRAGAMCRSRAVRADERTVRPTAGLRQRHAHRSWKPRFAGASMDKASVDTYVSCGLNTLMGCTWSSGVQ